MTGFQATPWGGHAVVLAVVLLMCPIVAECQVRTTHFEMMTDLNAVPQAPPTLRTQQIRCRADLPISWSVSTYLGYTVLGTSVSDPARIPEKNQASPVGAEATITIRLVPNLHRDLPSAFAARPMELDGKPVTAGDVSSNNVGLYPALMSSRMKANPPPLIWHRKEIEGTIAWSEYPGSTAEIAYLVWVSPDLLAYVNVTAGYVEPFGEDFVAFSQDLNQILSTLVFETGPSLLVEGFDGTDRKNIPLTFLITLLEKGKPAPEKRVGIELLNPHLLKAAVAVWEENQWRVIEDPALAKGHLPEELRPQTNKDGQVLLRVFLDFGKAKLSPPQLPVAIGLRGRVAGRPKEPLIEAEAVLMVRHAAFLCGAYYIPDGQPFQHLADLPSSELSRSSEPRPWDAPRDGKSRLLDSIPRGNSKSGPSQETAASSIILNGQELTRWTGLDDLRNGFLPLESSSILELNALADEELRSLSYFPKRGALGVRILWLDGTEGILTVRAPGRIAVRIESLPNYRLTPSGQQAEALVYLLIAEVPEELVEIAIVSSVSFVAGPTAAIAAIFVSEGIEYWGRLKLGRDVMEVFTKAPNGRLILIKSRFTLTRDPDGSEVLTVMEGSPSYTHAGSPTVTIGEGQRMVRPSKGRPRVIPADRGNDAGNRLISVLSGTALRPRQTKKAPPKTLDLADRERLDELCEAILAGRAADSDLTVLTKLAAKGPPWIWTVVGIAYENGNGVPQSKSLAATCYRLAAEKGDAWGQYRLGRVLVEQIPSGTAPAGIDVQSIKWLEASGKAGYAPALLELGRCAREGVAMPKSPDQAFRWFQEAASLGNPQAQFVVGEHHLFGNLVAENREEAHRWFERAAAQGLPEAQYFAYFSAPEQTLSSEDARWLRLAARQGHAEAQETLARKLLLQKQPLMDVEAIGWLERAAKRNRASAAELLGDVCLSGVGLPRDNDTARSWYLDAIRLYQADLGENATPSVQMIEAKIDAIK